MPSHALGALYSNNTPTQKNGSIQKYGNQMMAKKNPVRLSDNHYQMNQGASSDYQQDYLEMQMAKNENAYGSVN